MKRILCIILLIFCGCKVLKDKKDVDFSKIERTKTIRKGDTLKYVVPKAVYKDTTIYVRNFEKQGSNTLRIAYDNNGQQQIDCISDSIDELKETITSLKDTSKTKETDFKTSTIIYIFLGLALLLIVNKIIGKFI